MASEDGPNIELVLDEVNFDDDLDAITIGTNIPLPGFTLVPKYTSRLSGCDGSLEDSDLVESSFAFRQDWIMRKGSDELALFEVFGDSMYPFTSEGDIVLVDLSDNDADEIIDGKAYAICEDGTVKIKRLVRQGGKLLIRSQDIAHYPDYEAGGDFSLIGRVIWIGHEVN